MTQSPEPPMGPDESADPEDLASEMPVPLEELDSVEGQYDEVYDGGEDPDLEAARELSEEREEDALTTDELRPEDEVTEYDAPDDPSTPTALGDTAFDEATEETIEERLAQEEPDQQP